jgi:hypothetical protein
VWSESQLDDDGEHMSASSNSEVAQLEDIEDQNAPGFSLLLELNEFCKRTN